MEQVVAQARSIFECQQCGHCCEGRGGIVLSARDLQRLAMFLRLEPDEVLRDYAEAARGKHRLRTSDNGWCVFFLPGIGCTVHEGKPDICRAWPFFRGNLEDQSSLAMARDFCPGIDKEASHAEFVEAGLAYLRENGLGARDASTEANALVPPSALFNGDSK